MKQSICLVFMGFLLQGLIISGCSSGDPDHRDSDEQVNQFDKSGTKNGMWELYADSVLVAKGRYDHGIQEGLWTYYYRNGHMKEEGHYKNGIKEGIWVEWYPDGELMWKGPWNRGSRRIEQKEAYPKLTFMGPAPERHILASDSAYDIGIRISNVPTSHLFVEVNHGTVSRVGQSDHFILHTSADSLLVLAVGYIPDLQFPDFRNLVREYHFQIR